MAASAALLHEALFQPAAARAGAPAVVWPSGTLTHAALARAARRIAGRLTALGVGRGDRVAICLPKCPEAVALIAGTLCAGAAYVPLDAFSPPRRLATLLGDAQPRLLIATAAMRMRLQELPAPLPEVVPVEVTGSGAGLEAWLAGAPRVDPVPMDAGETAALLYTSGSSGEPKAVMLSHHNIASFVDWATQRFGLRPEDRFTSHAPLHFDLSMLDLFAPLALGASVVLIDEKTARFPAAVVRTLAEQRCTVWYSVPTALHGMLERGGLGERPLPDLRFVFFAGEVFPVASLRRLMRALPGPQYANWYGPTETNVCTYHVLPEPPDATTSAIPIGTPCEHLDVRVHGEDGGELPAGRVGELCVFGPAVMQGYWRRPALTDGVRVGGRRDSYRTGDLGGADDAGRLFFHGRRDQQVKVGGHRVELLEIERVLAAHGAIGQAAVVCSRRADFEVRLIACFSSPDAAPSSSELHRHCAAELPPYAVPSAFVRLDRLPLTARGKIDRERLAALARDLGGSPGR